MELKVQENAVQEAFEKKKLRYSELAAEAEQQGWSLKISPVEVGCRGFVATSTVRLIRDLGISGQALRQAIKETAAEGGGVASEILADLPNRIHC